MKKGLVLCLLLIIAAGGVFAADDWQFLDYMELGGAGGTGGGLIFNYHAGIMFPGRPIGVLACAELCVDPEVAPFGLGVQLDYYRFSNIGFSLGGGLGMTYNGLNNAPYFRGRAFFHFFNQAVKFSLGVDYFPSEGPKIGVIAAMKVGSLFYSLLYW
jgi:hypothetical protein